MQLQLRLVKHLIHYVDLLNLPFRLEIQQQPWNTFLRNLHPLAPQPNKDARNLHFEKHISSHFHVTYKIPEQIGEDPRNSSLQTCRNKLEHA